MIKVLVIWISFYFLSKFSNYLLIRYSDYLERRFSERDLRAGRDTLTTVKTIIGEENLEIKGVEAHPFNAYNPEDQVIYLKSEYLQSNFIHSIFSGLHELGHAIHEEDQKTGLNTNKIFAVFFYVFLLSALLSFVFLIEDKSILLFLFFSVATMRTFQVSMSLYFEYHANKRYNYLLNKYFSELPREKKKNISLYRNVAMTTYIAETAIWWGSMGTCLILW